MSQGKTPNRPPQNIHRLRRMLDRLRHLRATHHAQVQRRSWFEGLIQRLRGQGSQKEDRVA